MEKQQKVHTGCFPIHRKVVVVAAIICTTLHSQNSSKTKNKINLEGNLGYTLGKSFLTEKFVNTESTGDIWTVYFIRI